MPYQELQTNLDAFAKLIHQVSFSGDEHINVIIKNYITQNIIMFNEIILVSLDKLKKLEKVNSINEIICIQTQLNHEIDKIIARTTQYFLKSHLDKVTHNYDEWLQAHCDFATD